MERKRDIIFPLQRVLRYIFQQSDKFYFPKSLGKSKHAKKQKDNTIHGKMICHKIFVKYYFSALIASPSGPCGIGVPSGIVFGSSS